MNCQYYYFPLAFPRYLILIFFTEANFWISSGQRKDGFPFAAFIFSWYRDERTLAEIFVGVMTINQNYPDTDLHHHTDSHAWSHRPGAQQPQGMGTTIVTYEVNCA